MRISGNSALAIKLLSKGCGTPPPPNASHLTAGPHPQHHGRVIEVQLPRPDAPVCRR